MCQGWTGQRTRAGHAWARCALPGTAGDAIIETRGACRTLSSLRNATLPVTAILNLPVRAENHLRATKGALELGATWRIAPRGAYRFKGWPRAAPAHNGSTGTPDGNVKSWSPCAIRTWSANAPYGIGATRCIGGRWWSMLCVWSRLSANEQPLA